MKTAILLFLSILTMPVLGQTDDITREKNQLNRELYSGADSPERVKEIKKRLWEIDEKYFQDSFNKTKKMREDSLKSYQKYGDIRNKEMAEEYTKVLCHKYKYRRKELDIGISAGYIEQDSKAVGLYSQYEEGIRENCK